MKAYRVRFFKDALLPPSLFKVYCKMLIFSKPTSSLLVYEGILQYYITYILQTIRFLRSSTVPNSINGVRYVIFRSSMLVDFNSDHKMYTLSVINVISEKIPSTKFKWDLYYTSMVLEQNAILSVPQLHKSVWLQIVEIV